MQDGQVKVFATPDCTKCSQAKRYLSEHGVDFEYLDITTNSEALREMSSLTKGVRSVPIIALCDRVLIGYDRVQLEKAVEDCIH